jgi:phosphoribosylamine-glycine ligase
VELAIRQALGEAIDPQLLEPKFQKPVSQRYLFPKPGTVVAVQGLEEVLADPAVFHAEVRVGPGDQVDEVENHPGRAGVVMTTGTTRRQAKKAAEAAVDRIKIVTD